MKALLMKIEQAYDTASQYVDYSRFDVYEITRKIVDLIEQNNGKKLEVKRSFTLLQGDKKDGQA